MTPEQRANEILRMARQARSASRALALADTATRNRALEAIAAALENEAPALLEANARDLAAASEAGLSAALIDRLRLTPERLASIADGVREIAALPDPVGREIESFTGAEDIRIRKVAVPIGVIAMIYESRPNVTIDAAALCLKAGNATILRGGRESLHSNLALAACAAKAVAASGLPEAALQLIPFPDRDAVPTLCQLDEWIDLVIPRGGHSLIEAVVSCSRVPVIKHYDGICHVYIDTAADPAMARAITLNAKCQRPGVCNAAETLLIHAAAAPSILPGLAADLHQAGVELRADPRAAKTIADHAPSVPTIPATEEDWTTEYLDLILSIRVVDDLAAAIEHINRYGSHHSDAIVTANPKAARHFLAAVDSAAVYWNASTRFTDGGQFGFGAEIGISTDKLHARGPMGLRELTSTKFLIEGSGQTRP